MTRKKGNMCTKCGVRHSAPTGKKCAHVKETENSTVNSQLGSVSNGIQASPSEVPKAVDADHLAPAVEVEERMDVVERSVTQMKSMMAQVLLAVGVKETDQELTESQVEPSSGEDDFVQVRSRKKKKSKRSHKKTSRRTRSTSASSVTSASESEEGNTKQYAQKRFLAKDVKAKSVEDILLIGVKSIEKALTDKCDPLPVVRHVKFLAEKATKRMFEPVAFIKYDEAVRKRVNETGIAQFGVIETDEVYSHFSIENTVKVTAKSSTFVKGGRGARAGASANKSEIHCIRFNNYAEGCKGRCSYLHACYVCESKDHGKRECPKKVNK